jgi:hypothetical protein
VFWGDVLDCLEHEGGDVMRTIKCLPRLTIHPVKRVEVTAWLLLEHQRQRSAGEAP